MVDSDWYGGRDVPKIAERKAEAEKERKVIEKLVNKHKWDKIADKSSIEILINILDAGDDEISALAADALGKIGGKRAVEPLIEALKNEM